MLKPVHRLLISCALLACLQASTPAQAQTPETPAASRYTRLTQPPCKTTHVQVEAGVSAQLCPGINGYEVLLLDSDNRMSATLLGSGAKRYPLDFSNTLTSHFSVIGKKAEWRVRGTQPAGIIVPLDAKEDPDTNATTRFLVVARIGPTTTCVVAKLTNTPANVVEARKLADASDQIACLTSSKSRPRL